MRLIGTLPSETGARRFVDYLLTRSIVAHAEEGADASWQLWVEDDDQLDAGLAELNQFRLAPADPRYDSAADAAALRKQEAKAAEQRRRNFRDVRTTMFARPTGATPVTYGVIGLCVLVFLIANFEKGRPDPGGEDTGGSTIMQALVFCDWHSVVEVAAQDPDGTVPRTIMFHDILAGQVWRLVSPAFLHLNFLHILFNLMWMLDLGRRIEPIKGSGRLLLLVLGTAAFSCVAEATWAAFSPRNPIHYESFLGLSGVVSGLFGYCWACGKLRPYERIAVGQQETGYMIGWLVICSFGFVGPIANAAHWGGLVVGVILGAAPTWWRKLRAR